MPTSAAPEGQQHPVHLTGKAARLKITTCQGRKENWHDASLGFMAGLRCYQAKGAV